MFLFHYKLCISLILLTFSTMVLAEGETTEFSVVEPPAFSFSTNEIYIPIVVVDDESSYTVKMNLTNNQDKLVFTVSEVNELPSFEERFGGNIQNDMNRQEIMAELGIPQKILNLEKKTAAFCSEPSLTVGSTYEQWEYSVDNSSQAPSGFVVWFSEVDDSPEWKVVGKVNGYSCI